MIKLISIYIAFLILCSCSTEYEDGIDSATLLAETNYPKAHRFLQKSIQQKQSGFLESSLNNIRIAYNYVKDDYDCHDKAFIIANYGHVLKLLNRHSEAVPLISKAIKYYEEAKDEEGMYVNYINISECYRELKKEQLAKQSSEKALKIAKKNNWKKGLSRLK